MRIIRPRGMYYKKRYEHRRFKITAYLHSILDLLPMKSETAIELKRVYNTINDAVRALQNLERSVDDDFVVAITLRKLDPRTRREWEIDLGDTDEPHSFSELSFFF